jgi:hypothetical protein
MLNIDSDKLQQLLGQTLIYQAIACQVIEILTDPPALVLQGHQERKIIQPNQYGDAGDRMIETFSVAVFNQSGNGLNPDLPELAGFDLLG